MTFYEKHGVDSFCGPYIVTVVVDADGVVIYHAIGWADPSVARTHTSWNPRKEGFVGKIWAEERPLGYHRLSGRKEKHAKEWFKYL